FFADHVQCAIDDKGKKSSKAIAIPAGAVLAGSDRLRHLQTGLRVGARDRFNLFDGMDQTIARTTSEVLRRERLRTAEGTVDAYVVKEEDEKDWFTEDGALLKSEAGASGSKWLREDLEQPRVVAPAPQREPEPAPVDRKIAPDLKLPPPA